MLAPVSSIFALLFGSGTILVGSGFLGTLLGMRATEENFAEALAGLLRSADFPGFVTADRRSRWRNSAHSRPGRAPPRRRWKCAPASTEKQD